MKRIMIDLETLDTTPNAVIVSAAFVDIGLLDDLNTGTNYFRFNVEDQKERTISPGTVKWWMQQSEEARAVFREPPTNNTRTIAAYIHTIAEAADELWGNGSDFDNAILANLLEYHGYKWPFWKNRCFRTIKAMYKDRIATDLVNPVEHNALEDAKFQARQLLSIEASLRGER